MSKFIFVSGSYDPFPKANAVCAKAIEETLKERGHEVIYVVTRHNIIQQDIELINGNRVFFIPKPINDIHTSFTVLKNAFFTSTIEKSLISIFHIILKVLFRITAFLNLKNSSERGIEIYRKNFINVMSKLLVEEKPDAVLTFSVPFNSHLFTLDAMQISGIRPLWYSFLIDAHKYKEGISKKDFEQFEKDEHRIFNRVDKSFFLSVLSQNYNNTEYTIYKEKFNYFRLPFFKIPLNTVIDSKINLVKNKGWIDVTFAGTLYDNSSPIGYLLSFIEACYSIQIRFHFIGKFYPKTLQMLTNVKDKMPNQIFIYGFKDRQFVLSFLQQSDVLLNIGNNNTNQIPSKILEYIGLLKPIFSFIRDDRDAALEYLNKYPYSYIIDENSQKSFDNVVTDSMLFYSNFLANKVSVEEIKSQYKGYLQEDVTKEIIEIIEKDING